MQITGLCWGKWRKCKRWNDRWPPLINQLISWSQLLIVFVKPSTHRTRRWNGELWLWNESMSAAPFYVYLCEHLPWVVCLMIYSSGLAIHLPVCRCSLAVSSKCLRQPHCCGNFWIYWRLNEWRGCLWQTVFVKWRIIISVSCWGRLMRCLPTVWQLWYVECWTINSTFIKLIYLC